MQPNTILPSNAKMDDGGGEYSLSLSSSSMNMMMNTLRTTTTTTGVLMAKGSSTTSTVEVGATIHEGEQTLEMNHCSDCLSSTEATMTSCLHLLNSSTITNTTNTHSTSLLLINSADNDTLQEENEKSNQQIATSLLSSSLNNYENNSSELNIEFNSGVNHSINSHIGTSEHIDESTSCFGRCNSLIQQLLYRIQPSSDSEKHRKEVFDIIAAVLELANLKTYLYGSVAFKTYLPDGDIDLSVFVSNEENLELSSAQNVNNLLSHQPQVNDSTISYVHNVLLKNMHTGLKQQLADPSIPWYNKARSLFSEIQRNNLAYIEDMTFINAEVKLIKCTVNNIPIDMSSGQIGGLSTLCFLHEVDDRICDNHLFKRSIILMKSWSYYESRILGSHHGLVSTYGLTVLLMYMFRLYKIESPLQALYRFLNYYSTFDWTNFGISIYGPIPLGSINDHKSIEDFYYENLPPERHDSLTSSFLQSCKSKYGTVDIGKSFMIKNLNIVDPLRDFNNLGRSVNYNNFLRIRRAIKRGSKTLTDILISNDLMESEKILTLFFKNVVEKYIPDITSFIQNGDKEHLPKVAVSFGESVFDSKLEDCRNCLETAHSLLGINSSPIATRSVESSGSSTNSQPVEATSTKSIPVPSTPPKRSNSFSNFIASPLSPLNSSAIYTRNLSLMHRNGGTSISQLGSSMLAAHSGNTNPTTRNQIDDTPLKSEADLTVTWTSPSKQKPAKKTQLQKESTHTENIDPNKHEKAHKQRTPRSNSKPNRQTPEPKKETKKQVK